jgi:hypothetical protein
MDRAVTIRVTVALAALLLLGACRDEDEVVFYEPHVYKGQTEPALSQATVADLEARAKQGGRL